MDKINSNTKNEVQELLQEIVVSPLSGNIDNKLSKLSQSLSLLEDVKKEFPTLGGKLHRTEDKINQHIDEKINEITGKLNSLELSIKSIKQQTEPIGGFAQATEEWIKFREEFPQVVKNTQEPLKSQITKQEGAIGAIYQLTKQSFEDLEKEIHRLKSENKNITILLVIFTILNFSAVVGYILMNLFIVVEPIALK